MPTSRFAQRIVTILLATLLLTGLFNIQPASARPLSAPDVTGSDFLFTREDTTVSGAFSIAFNPPVVVTIETQPTHGYIPYIPKINANQWYEYDYIPNADYNGDDSFSFMVTDNIDGSSTTFTVNVVVSPVVDDPVAVDDGVYTFAPLTSDWIDTLGATELSFGASVDDGKLGEITLPASWTGGFPFFPSDGSGSTYSKIYAYANGLLSFNNYTGSVNVSSVALPDEMAPHATIIPLGGDKYAVQDITKVYSQYLPASDQFVITYLKLANYCAECTPHYTADLFSSFQVVLYPQGRIDFNYQTVNGYTRTAGIENVDSQHGLNLARGSVQSGSSYAFTPQPWIATVGQTVTGWNVKSGDYHPDGLALGAATLLPDTRTHLGSLTLNIDGSLEYTATDAGTDIYNYQLAATNPKTQSATGQIVIRNVGAANQSPVFTPLSPSPWNVQEGVAHTLAVVASDPDIGQTLAYSAYGLPLNSSFDAASHTFSFTPDETQGGSSYTVTFVVTDNGVPAASAEIKLTIIVDETNTAPTLAAIADKSVSELSPLSFISPSPSDSDLPAQGFTYSLTEAPAGASINSVSGDFTWTPSEDQGPSPAGGYNVTVKVTDSGTPALSAEQSFSIAVSEVNAQHTLTQPTDVSIPEQAAWTFAMAGQVVDSDRPTGLPENSYTFALTTSPASTASIDSAGMITWTPTEAQGPATYTFTVTATDKATPGLSAATTFSVIVTEGNTAPALVLTGVPATAQPELTAITFTAVGSDSDVPVQTLTYSLSAAPLNAAIDVNTGVFTWTPSELQGPGSYPFDVIVYDGVTTTSQRVTLTVSEVNTAPVLPAITSQSIAELTPLSFTVLAASDSDVPAQTLTYSLSGAPAGATIDAASHIFTWTPTELQGAGSYSVTVNVFDGITTASQIFTIDVSEVNHPVVVASRSGDTDIPEGSLHTWELYLGDSDLEHAPGTLNGNTYNFALTTVPASSAAINPTTSVFTWTPSESDGGQSFTVKVLVTDNTIADPTTYVCATSDPACTRYDFFVWVNEANTAPTLGLIANQSVAELSPLSFSASASDSDLPLQTFTYSLTQAPAGATIDSSSGIFTWTPSEDQGPSPIGGYNVTVKVTDSGTPALSAEQSFSIAVSEVNAQHTFTKPADVSIPEQAAWTLPMAGSTGYLSDDDLPTGLPENSYTFALTTNPASTASIDSAGMITWTPTEAEGTTPATDYTFTVTATDKTILALSASVAFVVTVNEVNKAPVIKITPNSTAFTVAEGSLLQFEVDIYDPDNVSGALTISEAPVVLWLTPTKTTQTVDGVEHNVYTYSGTPTEAQGPGLYTVGFEAWDNDPDNPISVNIVITVTEVNVPPVLTLSKGNTITVNEGDLLTFTASATDADFPAQPLTYSIAGAPANASFVDSIGVRTFSWQTAEGDGQKNFAFDVTTTDGVVSVKETVLVTVNEVNHPVSVSALSGSSLTVLEGSTATWTPTLADSDLAHTPGSLDGNTYTYALTNQPANASIAPTTGVITWATTETDGPASYDFTLLVTDRTYGATPSCITGNPACMLYPFTVAVSEVLTQPTINPLAPIVVDEGQRVAFSLTVDDIDWPNNTLTVSPGTLPANAVFNNQTLAFSWQTGEADGPGIYPITFTVDDGSIQPNLVNNTTVSITVNAVNDLSLSVSESDDPILLGQVLFYNLTVTNLDPDSASGVVVTASLPAGTSFTASQSSSQCAAGALPNTVTCTVGSVAGSASSSIIIAARVPETMTEGALIDFSASVAATQTDPALANNSTSAQTTIGANSVVYEDDFTDGSNGQWSEGGTSTTPSGRTFLGEFNNQSITLTIPELPSHSKALVTFDLFLLRSWDGNLTKIPTGMNGLMPMLADVAMGPDLWEFVADGNVLTHNTFSNWHNPLFFQSYPGTDLDSSYPSFTGAAEFASLGYDFIAVPGMDSVYSMSHAIKHTGDTLTLTFRDLGLQSKEDESWGLDNIKVVLSGGPYESYSVYMPVVKR